MKATSLDGIIERVAKENGYALLKDDLQMVLITIMNQIVEDQQAGVVAALENYKEVHSDIALRWQTDAALTKQRAEGNRLLRELKVSSYLTAAGSCALAAGAVLMAYMAMQ